MHWCRRRRMQRWIGGGIMQRISGVGGGGREAAAGAHRRRHHARMLLLLLLLLLLTHGWRCRGRIGVVPRGGVGADLRRSAHDVLGVVKLVGKFSFFRRCRRSSRSRVVIGARSRRGDAAATVGAAAIRGAGILFTLRGQIVIVMRMRRRHAIAAAVSHIVR